MSDVQVLEIVSGALAISAKLAMPILTAALTIGVVVSVLQTITSVQEQSLTFVPKLIAVGGIIAAGGSWMIRELTTWVTTLWTSIPTLL